MPSSSPHPSIDIPNIGLWDLLFARDDRPFPADKVIYTDSITGRSYTYAQIKSTAEDFGKGLKAVWGWRKNDVCCLFTPNNIDTPVVTWGIHWAGGIVTPANPGYTVDELTHQLKDSKAKAIITQKALLPVVTAAAKRVGIPEDMIALLGDERDPDARFKHFTSVRNISGATRYARAKVANPEKDLAFIAYSSGTTGLPKGVMLTHRNIVSNTLQNAAVEKNLKWDPTPSQPDGDSILAFLPFFHIYGLTCILHQAAYKGLKCVVMPRFDLELFCKAIQEHKISMAYVVPPVILALSKHPIVDKYNLSSLRMMNSGAAPLTRELVDAAYARIKIPIKQGYGLSETSPTTHTQRWEDWDRSIGSVGFLLPNMTAKYMSAEEKELPQGEVGELWVKGPNVFLGYLNNAEGTRNALTDDGYFRTGDVGYQAADGSFFITDRVKELIKYKGFQVPPAELEGLLLSHDKINDVAVLGVHREDLASEVPLAYVVLKPDVTASDAVAKGITDWLAAKVANHKKLRGGVRFTNEIPKSVSGKILRRMLKAKYAEDIKKETAPVKAKL